MALRKLVSYKLGSDIVATFYDGYTDGGNGYLLDITGTGDVTSSLPYEFYRNYLYDRNIAIVVNEGITGFSSMIAYWNMFPKSISLPSTFSNIGPGAFAHIIVSELTIPEGVSELGRGCFYNGDRDYFVNQTYETSYCTGDGTINLPSTLKRIGQLAFEGQSMSTLILPDQLEFIGLGAFVNMTKLTSIHIPKNAMFETLDDEDYIRIILYAPINSAGTLGHPKATSDYGGLVTIKDLEEITVDPDNPYYCSIDGVLFSKDMTKLLVYPSGKKDSVYTIPPTVNTLQRRAFFETVNLTKLIFPEDLLTMSFIGIHTDYHQIFVIDCCKALTSIVLPLNLTVIPRHLLFAYYSYPEMAIPDTVVDIECNSCVGISQSTLIIPKSVKHIGYFAFPETHSNYAPHTIIMYSEDCVIDQVNPLVDSDLYPDVEFPSQYRYAGVVGRQLFYTMFSVLAPIDYVRAYTGSTMEAYRELMNKYEVEYTDPVSGTPYVHGEFHPILDTISDGLKNLLGCKKVIRDTLNSEKIFNGAFPEDTTLANYSNKVRELFGNVKGNGTIVSNGIYTGLYSNVTTNVMSANLIFVDQYKDVTKDGVYIYAKNGACPFNMALVISGGVKTYNIAWETKKEYNTSSNDYDYNDIETYVNSATVCSLRDKSVRGIAYLSGSDYITADTYNTEISNEDDPNNIDFRMSWVYDLTTENQKEIDLLAKYQNNSTDCIPVIYDFTVDDEYYDQYASSYCIAGTRNGTFQGAIEQCLLNNYSYLCTEHRGVVTGFVKEEWYGDLHVNVASYMTKVRGGKVITDSDHTIRTGYLTRYVISDKSVINDSYVGNLTSGVSRSFDNSIPIGIGYITTQEQHDAFVSGEYDNYYPHASKPIIKGHCVEDDAASGMEGYAYYRPVPIHMTIDLYAYRYQTQDDSSGGSY